MQLPRAGRVFLILKAVLDATEKPEAALLGQR
jgi:hypothetical protein